MVKVITFDFWNTLFLIQDGASIGKIRMEGIQRVLERHGQDRGKQQIVQGLQYSWSGASYEQRAHGRDMGPHGQLNLLMGSLDLPLSGQIWDDMYEVITSVLEKVPPPLMTGARETLAELEGKYDLAVICNTGATPGIILRKFMKSEGILDLFKTVVFSNETGLAKPNPAIFTHTLEQLGRVGDTAIHVGDDPLTDIIGAKRAGLKAAWFAPHQSWTVPECDWHIMALDEVPRIGYEMAGE